MLSMDEKHALEKATLIAQVMSILKYDAVNLGGNEFLLPPAVIDAFAAAGDYPLVCADVVSGKMAWKPFTVIVRKGLRIGVVGVGGSLRIPGSETLSTEPPLKAIQKALIAMRGKADMVILLSQMPYGDMLALLSRVDGVDVAITGGERVQPFRLKNTVVTGYSDRGQYVAALKILWNPQSRSIEDFSQENHHLTEVYIPDERLKPLFDKYNMAIGEKNKAEKQESEKKEALVQKLRKMSPEEFMKVYKEQMKLQSENQGVATDAK